MHWRDDGDDDSLPVMVPRSLADAAPSPSRRLHLSGLELRGRPDSGAECPVGSDGVERSAQDRARVNVNEDHEVRYWTQKWGVSKEQLAVCHPRAVMSCQCRPLGRYGKSGSPRRAL